VDCVFEPVTVHTARWIACEDAAKLKAFVDKNDQRMAKDHYGDYVYLASSPTNLNMTMERHPEVRFLETKEHGQG
jgi:peptide chain release factor 3